MVTLLASAAGPPPRPAVGSDQLDYVFLGSDRPVLLRLHVRIGEKPYDSAWNDWMDRMFAWFDFNSDGVGERSGFALMLNNEVFFFESALPASGTRWHCTPPVTQRVGPPPDRREPRGAPARSRRLRQP